jgi:hypothetical protein
MKLLAAVLICTLSLDEGIAQSDQDGYVLLAGVEQARTSLEFGAVEMVLDFTNHAYSKRGTARTHLRIDFHGPRRKAEQRRTVLWFDKTTAAKVEPILIGDYEPNELVERGLVSRREVTTRTVFNDDCLAQYSKDAGCYIRDPARGMPDFVFDPRILGLEGTLYYAVNMEPGCFTNYAKQIETLADSVDGSRHVAFRTSVEGQETHLWINGVTGFPVRRCKVILSSQVTEIHSEYDKGFGGGSFPNDVTIKVADKTGTPITTTRVHVTKADFTKGPGESELTLVGLALPVGETVIDDRLQKVVGYWDGNKISKEFPTNQVQANIVASEPGPNWFLYANIVVIIVCSVCLYLRHLRRSSS